MAALVAFVLPLALAACGDDAAGQADGGRDGAMLPRPDADLFDGGATLADAGQPVRRDGGPQCVSDGCDPLEPADGTCAGALRCVLRGPEPSCAPTGAVPLGSLCRAVDPCVEGAACFARVTGDVCARVCCPGDDRVCGGGRCAEVARLVGGVETSWGLCTGPRPCDLLAYESACEPGEACYAVGDPGATDCRTEGLARVGERCERQDDCAARHFCAGRPGSARCERLCALEAPEPPCPASQRCAALSGAPSGVGLCVPR